MSAEPGAVAAASNPEIGSTIDVGGCATNYHDLGSGAPVVLLHGSGPGVSAFANWRLAMPALAQDFRVIAPDIVGFGFTERPADGRYDLDRWLAHALGLLDALGLERVSLVGNSFGGGLALRLAVTYPERVDRLVLMGAVGVSFPLTHGLDAVWGYEPSVDAMQRLIETFVFDAAGFDPTLAIQRHRASVREGVQESYAAMFPAPRQRWIDALASSEESIRELPHETLVLHGRDDRVIPLAASLRIAALIDRSQLHVFGRCGHWVQLEQAGRFQRLVRDFLSESR